MLCLVLASVGCRRPDERNRQLWEENPGLSTLPTGQTLQGKFMPPLPRTSFRLDVRRGMMTSLSPETEKSEKKGAAALYRQAAESGQAWAQTQLGLAYLTQGSTRNVGEGLYWLRAAADQNDIEALRTLSTLAMEGQGMPQSDEEAYTFMSRAAELGSPEAQYSLAGMLLSGRGMSRDPGAALVWARKSAAQNFAPGQFLAARLLIESIEQDRKNEALELLQSAIASEYAPAAVFLAAVTVRGEFGVPRDEKAAEELLKPFAEKGDAGSQFALGSLYKFGGTYTNRRDDGDTWLRLAAKQGHAGAIEILKKGKKAEGH